MRNYSFRRPYQYGQRRLGSVRIFIGFRHFRHPRGQQTSTRSSDAEEEQKYTDLHHPPPIPVIAQAQLHYNELIRFIENKPEVSDERF